MKHDLYFPERGDLVHRVCTWLSLGHNRGASLTAADVARKFGVASVHVVRCALEPGVIHGFLAEKPVPGEAAYFEAGPRLPELLAIPTTRQIGAPMATTPVFLPAPPKKTRTRLPLLDVAKLKVEKSVPIPERQYIKGKSRYDAIFEALKPGTSLAVPAAYLGAMRKAAEQRTKAHPGSKFVVRRVSENETRIWRTA